VSCKYFRVPQLPSLGFIAALSRGLVSHPGQPLILAIEVCHAPPWSGLSLLRILCIVPSIHLNVSVVSLDLQASLKGLGWRSHHKNLAGFFGCASGPKQRLIAGSGTALASAWY
jgi:hypothetical protein